MLIGNLQLWYLSVQGRLISSRNHKAGLSRLWDAGLWRTGGDREGRREVRVVGALEKRANILRGGESGVINQ